MEAMIGNSGELARKGQLLPDHLLGVQPAAGASFSFNLDARWWWRFRSIRCRFVADANVANRYVTVDFTDPEGTAWIRNPSLAVVAAGVTQDYDFSRRNNPVSGIAGQPQFADLDETFIPPGWLAQINVANVQVGDQLSRIRLYVEKFEPA